MRITEQWRCGDIPEEADGEARKCGGEGLRAGVYVVCAGAAGGWAGRFGGAGALGYGRAGFALRPESEFARELGRRFDLGLIEGALAGGFVTGGFQIEGILVGGILIE